MIFTHLKAPILKVIELLASRRYGELEDLTNHIRLNRHDIAKVIADYGREITLPPDEAFELMDVVVIQNRQNSCWSVNMPLWTKEEGRSDLTIEMTLIAINESFKIELDDIRVL